MPWKPTLSLVPPAAGHSKPLFSPDLFDSTTGDYPKAAPPTSAGYQRAYSGPFQFYEGSIGWGTLTLTFAAPPEHISGVHPIVTKEYWVDAFDVTVTYDSAGLNPVMDDAGHPIVFHIPGTEDFDDATLSQQVPQGTLYLHHPAQVLGYQQITNDDGTTTTFPATRRRITLSGNLGSSCVVVVDATTTVNATSSDGGAYP